MRADAAMKRRPLDEADAKALGWNSLQDLVDHVAKRLGTDDATANKAMEDDPDAWRSNPELKRQ